MEEGIGSINGDGKNKIIKLVKYSFGLSVHDIFSFLKMCS